MKTARPPFVLAALVGAGLGFVLGVPHWRDLTRFPLERVSALADLPRPVGIDWWDYLRQPAALVESFDRLLVALAVVLLLAAFWLLARSLNPEFTLRLDGEAGRRPGGAAWLDVPLLARCGLAFVVSLWLIGAAWPLGTLFSRGQASSPLAIASGGIPALAALLPGILYPVAVSLVMVPALWLLWGPSGLAHVRDQRPAGPVLPWAVLAGMAAFPAVVLLYPLRAWLAQVAGAQTSAPALPLVDRGAWNVVFLSALLLPALAGLLLAGVAAVFRPRSLPRQALRIHIAGAVVLLLSGLLVHEQFGARVHRLDAGAAAASGLAARLNLPPSDLRRFALVSSPDGRVVGSSPIDGSDDGRGRDIIAANGRTHDAVLNYLRARRYRTGLIDRAFIHLHACNSLDWLSTRSLQVNLEVLKRSPSRLVSTLLMEKLAACPITPENRAVLNELADESKFVQPRGRARAWYGLAFRRFGDQKRSREFLQQAELSGEELRRTMGGIAPLTNGVVRGRFLVPGPEKRMVRIGLVAPEPGVELLGLCPPAAWRWVIDLAYTDRNGRFEFRNVPEGRYLLVATGGGIGRDPREPVLSPSPGVIEVDRFRPVAELPPMQLRYEGRGPGGPGPTMALAGR